MSVALHTMHLEPVGRRRIMPEATAYRSEVPVVVAPPARAPAVPSVSAPVETMVAPPRLKPPPAVSPPTTRSRPAIAAQVPASMSASASLSPSATPHTASIAMASPNGASPVDQSRLDAPLVGRAYQQSVPVDRFEVPLPPGQWAMMASGSVKSRGGAGIACFLGKIEHRRMIGAVRISALRGNDHPGAGFPAFNGCVPGNPTLNRPFVDSIARGGREGCWLSTTSTRHRSSNGPIGRCTSRGSIAKRRATWPRRALTTRRVSSMCASAARRRGACWKCHVSSIPGF